jgi:hypothetical protein
MVETARGYTRPTKKAASRFACRTHSTTPAFVPLRRGKQAVSLEYDFLIVTRAF